MHKIVSRILGTLSLCAGIVALVGYAFPALHDLMPLPAGRIVYGRDSLSQRLFAVLIIWSLTLAAFYMGFRFLRLLDLLRKP
jgi:hypothetical protein